MKKTLTALVPAVFVLVAFWANIAPPTVLPDGQGQETPPGPNCQQAVQTAVAGLASTDEATLQNSIGQLRELASCPDIQSAIFPLRDVLTDASQDYTTRRLAFQALLAIAQSLGLPQGKVAYQVLQNASVAYLLDVNSDLTQLRDAISYLQLLAADPGILAATGPLELILQDAARFDSFTRALAAQTLVVITREQGLPNAQAALDAVTSALVGDRLDVLRAQAAAALSSLRSADPSALAALEYAYFHDGSPLVQTSAYRSLIILTNGAYQTFGLSAQSFSRGAPEAAAFSAFAPTKTATPPLSAVAGAGSAPPCLSDELYAWVRDHVIILDPAVHLEDLRCRPESR